jgi:hypothetical protein
MQISGAVGLAVLGTVAANRTTTLGHHHDHIAALVGGYDLAFVAAAAIIATGIVVALLLLGGPARHPAAYAPTSPDEACPAGSNNLTVGIPADT